MTPHSGPLSLFKEIFLLHFWRYEAFAAGLSLVFGEQGPLSMAVLRPLAVVTSLVQISGSRPAGISSWRHVALVVAAPGLQAQAQ